MNLTGLNQTYNGTPRLVGATTNPSGKTVEFTYEGSATAPTAAGSYAVVGTINAPIYQGTASGTLVVGKASQTITFGAIADQIATATVNLSATGGGSGNDVTFAVTGGPDVIDGGTSLTFTAAGEVSVTASQEGSSNYFAADNVTHTFTVTRAAATVSLWRLAGRAPSVWRSTSLWVTSAPAVALWRCLSPARRRAY